MSYEHLTTILTFVSHYAERTGIDEVDIFKGKGKLTFSAQHQWISAFRSPACWLYPLMPGGEWKSTDVQRKTVTLIYLDPIFK